MYILRHLHFYNDRVPFLHYYNSDREGAREKNSAEKRTKRISV